MNEIDVIQDAVELPTEEEVGRLTTLVRRQIEVEDFLVELEEAIKEKRELLRGIAEGLIPSLMDEIGLGSFSMTDGTKIEVKKDVKLSFPKSGEKREAALAWLRERDFGSIIKNIVVASFSAGEDENALELYRTLSDEGYVTMRDESVHPGTLRALINEQLAEGVNVPLEVFGGFDYKVAKITRPKERKGGRKNG